MQLTPRFRSLGSISLLLAAALGAAPQDPLPAHVARDLEGWTIEVDRRLLEGEHEALGSRALRRLEAELFDVATVMPAERVAELRRVRIRVDLDHPLEHLQYHPDLDWLEEHGHDPTLVNTVHLPQVEPFLDLMAKNWQPWVILHELAHAYHDQVLGFDDARVLGAFAKARDSGRYGSVLHIRGKMRRHYALTDPKEFFAEMTEAYFGTNDFHPFVRAELELGDPETYALLEEIWGELPD